MSAPTARFKELCLDSHSVDGGDPNALSRFWAAAAGLGLSDPGPTADWVDVVGPEEGQGISVSPVPEPKTVKHRVHPDVSVADVGELLALGATVVREPDEEVHWTVMADPEGGEFCAMVQPPERLADYRIFELVVDSADPEASARWWADVFGVEAENDGRPWWWITGVPGFPSTAVAPFWAMVFAPVPEPKTVKNRWHWDVYGDVDDLVARGASVLWELPRWTTLADPEGNEFCVFPEG